MECCETCFGDRFLKRQIVVMSTSRGRCSYCGNTNGALVGPKKLSDYFDGVMGAYALDSAGSSLIECLDDDWGTFSPESEFKQELLEAIVGEKARRDCLYIRRRDGETLNAQSWVKLREELQKKNRFFPKVKIDEGLIAAIDRLWLDPTKGEHRWFRARIEGREGQFKEHEMGAPPADISTGGRANPPGIPYLYLGSNVDSVTLEVRPHPGQRLTIAEFALRTGLKIVDLREPAGKISPFDLENLEDVRRMRGYVEFIRVLAKELARPVIPSKASIDYVPSQYICEYIKESKYQGVLYNSANGRALNLVLFNTDDATLIEGSLFSQEILKIGIVAKAVEK